MNQVHEPYCDDEQIFVTENSQLMEIDEIFSKFENMSGAILNRDSKTKIMGLGAWKDKTEWGLPWIQVVRKMKSLGFTLGQSFRETSSLSWKDVVDKMRNLTNIWYSRILPTLKQRIIVVHTFLASLVWYKAAVLKIPKKVLESMESIIGTFLWKGWIERVPLEVLQSDYLEGGMRLVDIGRKGDAILL